LEEEEEGGGEEKVIGVIVTRQFTKHVCSTPLLSGRRGKAFEVIQDWNRGGGGL
jgi:hypothetical protein